MEIGSVVTFRGRSWYVRGFDPHGVTPRYVYLEDARTGRRLTVLRDRLPSSDASRRRASPLHLVDPEPDSADSQ